MEVPVDICHACGHGMEHHLPMEEADGLGHVDLYLICAKCDCDVDTGELPDE